MTRRVRASLSPVQLAALAARQCDTLVPDGEPVAADALMTAVPRALDRLEHCFQAIDNKYFFDGETALFSHLHGDQYCMWLYLLANELHAQRGPANVCAKLFLLNKALNGCDIFYEVALPSIFLLVHPLGTVLGRGTYADYFVSYQRVGVGSNHDVYPRFGHHVTLRPGASVLGRCAIGEECQIAAESLVIDRDVPAGHVYLGGPKDHRVRPDRTPYPLWRR